MAVSNLRQGATRCWARNDDLLCGRVQGHPGFHVCGTVRWVDFTDRGDLLGVVDVDLDNYDPEGAA